MGSIYQIQRGDEASRQAVESWLAGLELLSAKTREMTVTAWVSAWRSSSFQAIEDMPFNDRVNYRLCDHVNEVTRTGLDLAKRAAAEWDNRIDHDVLVPILILHDLDKPLLYVREDGKVRATPLKKQLPHGGIGGMMLHEIGFPIEVVSAVAMHSPMAEFHAHTFEGYILHYADHFAADHAFITGGAFPVYQMKLTKPESAK